MASEIWAKPAFAGQNVPRPLDRRYLALFFAKVEVDACGCWVWRGARNNTFYGHFMGESAHRTSHRWFVGPIPEGWQVDHLCRHRWCVNPAHLEAVTKSVNELRARDAAGVCKNGHPWTSENVMTVQVGKRSTRTCVICWKAKVERAGERRRKQRHAA